MTATVDIASVAPAGVRFERPDADGVARIVIDRPTDAVNAIDPPLIVALSEAVASARAARPRGLVKPRGKPSGV
jgi:enoyl-CoA hydratase/carnithine racemase